MMDPAVGSAGTENQAMHWATTTSSVTLKNGKFVVASNVKSTHMGKQSHTTFTANGMIFDFSNVTLKHYDRQDKWSTFEKPIFNNNKGKTMTLQDCSITMPSLSTKGISANDSETNGTGEYGGELILDDTEVKGYVNLQSTVGKLTVKGKNKIDERQVVSYFAGYTVVRSVSDGVDTYTLKNN